MIKPFIILLGLSLIFSIHPFNGWGQEIPVTTEQQLENLADAEQGETEDDTYLQDLEQFKRHPINLNIAVAEELK